MMSNVRVLFIIILSGACLSSTSVPVTGQPGVIGYLTSIVYLRWAVMDATVKDEAENYI